MLNVNWNVVELFNQNEICEETGNKVGTTNFLKLKIIFSHTMFPTYCFPSFYSSQSLPTSPPTPPDPLFSVSH